MEQRRLTWVVLALAVACCAVTPLAAADRGTGLTASLDMRSFVDRGERAMVSFTLRNDSTEDVYVLQWQTPFHGLEHEIFEVRRDGVQVAYLGPHIKFGAPRPEHYIRLAAGASRTVRVDLGAIYDLSRTGEYAVQYRVNVQDAIRLDGPLPELAFIESNQVFAAVERDERLGRVLASAAARPITGNASTSYVKCTASQQSQLASARSNATNYSSNSNSYLGSHTSSNAGPRYSTWFGALDSGRYNTVKSHFGSILTAFQNADVTFNCGCKKQYYAYVYPTQPYTIYLCRVFWTAPATGTDSKAGTLVHEMSHFNVVAGTDDWAYGQSACRSLANSNAKRAVDNADSHEYFAENTPAQN
jgi:peptidyl-Lys metalloendopeptidase